MRARPLTRSSPFSSRGRSSRLPPAQRLHLLRREQLAAALLPEGSTGANAEIEIVEDLVPGFVPHIAHCSLLRPCEHASCTCPTCTSAREMGSMIQHWKGRSAA